MPRRFRPEWWHGGVAAAVTVALVLIAHLALRLPWWRWDYLLAEWLLAANVVAFGYYGYDKAQAGGSAARVPEVVLHGLVVVGGTAGAYAGMRLFRHKTIKGAFQVVFWYIVLLQALLVAALVYRLLTH
jgi:uncharacterized membrane protein YsdA (DUF1294 family)